MRWIPWRSSSWSDTMPNECIQVSMGVLLDALFFNASHGSLGLRQMAAACWGSLPSDGMVILENLIFKCIIVISMRLFRVHSFYHLCHILSKFGLFSLIFTVHAHIISCFHPRNRHPEPGPSSHSHFQLDFHHWWNQTRLFNTLTSGYISSYVVVTVYACIYSISSLSLSIYI